MKIVKKLPWHAAAIAAAVVVSGAAQAEHRDGNYRGGNARNHGNGYHDSHGGDYRRVWRDQNRYRSYDHGHHYRSYSNSHYYPHYSGGHYIYAPHRYYSYGNGYYYGAGWPAYDFGATLTFQIPLY